MKIAVITNVHANRPALRATPNLKCVKGNHELDFVNGLPKPQPEWMSDGEVQHQIWTHEQLGNHRKSIVSQGPMVLEDVIDGSKTIFVHYGLTSLGNDFIGVLPNPSSLELDRIFAEQSGDMSFLVTTIPNQISKEK